MQIETLPIDQPNPAPYNPRIDLKPGDPAYEKLRRSIEHFGYVEPIIVNRRTGHVVGGHQRLKVLRDLGRPQVEAVMVDLPLEREKALNVALNKVEGGWDEGKLARLLDELTQTPEIDVEVTGFDLPDVEELLAGALGEEEGEEESFDEEAALDQGREPVTQAGELIELGRHRLLCGDCMDTDQIRRLMDGERAALFATDPPYLVGYDGTNHPGKSKDKLQAKRKNKDWSASYAVTWDDAAANPQLYEKFIRVAVDHAIRPDAAWYCFHASRRQAMVEGAWGKCGAFVHQQIVWVKDRPVLNRSWYTWQHEPCFFGWVRPNKPPRHAEEHLSTVWQVPTIAAGQKTDHPTSKPLEVFAIPMRQHTRRGELCYEPFCGSGSQLIAAQKLGRRCFALEISPRYCDVIVRRWISFVGEAHAPRDLVERYRITREAV